MDTLSGQTTLASALACRNRGVLAELEEAISFSFVSGANQTSDFRQILANVVPAPGDSAQAEAILRNTELHSVDGPRAQKIEAANTRLLAHNQNVQKKIDELKQKKLLLGLGMPHPRNIGAQMMQLDNRIAKLEKEIKPPLAFHAIMAKIDAILNGPLSAAEKKVAIETIRNGAGLSTGEMRGLFTNRVRDVYRDSANRLVSEQQALAAQANPQMTLASSYGSPLFCGATQPFYTGIKQLGDARALQSEVDRLRGVSSTAGGLYPKRHGFWSRFKHAFSRVGNVFKRVAQPLFQRLITLGKNAIMRVMQNILSPTA